MNVEILDFFLVNRKEEKKFLNGTLKIRLPDIGIVLLGIFVSKKKDNWFFSLPTRGDGINPENGQSVRYPVFIFEDQEKQKALINVIKVQGRAFIEQRLADKEKSLIFPQQQQNELKQSETPKVRDKAAASKKTASIEKQEPVLSIASKEWRDLPPLQPKLTARYISKFGRR